MERHFYVWAHNGCCTQAGPIDQHERQMTLDQTGRLSCGAKLVLAQWWLCMRGFVRLGRESVTGSPTRTCHGLDDDVRGAAVGQRVRVAIRDQARTV